MAKKTEVVAKQETLDVAATALVTLEPETYVAAVYEPFLERLNAALKETENVKYDVTTTDGMAVAKKYRALFRDIRTQGETERKSRKAPILSIGKLLDSRYEELTTLIRPHETKFDDDIKAEEQRKENEKAERIRKEAERATEIQARLDSIKNKPLDAITLNVAGTEALIEELEKMPAPTKEQFDDRYVEAEIAIKVSLQALTGMLEGKRAAETLEAQRKAREAEEQRVAVIRHKIQTIKNTVLDAAEVDTSAEIQMLITKLSNAELIESDFDELFEEAKQAVVSTLAALKRHYDAMVFAEKQAEEVRRQAEEARRNAPAEPHFIGTAPVPSEPPKEVAPAAQVQHKPAEEAIDTGSKIKLGQISTLLGFTVSESFLGTLGFKGDHDRNSVQYRECDFPLMCEAVIKHIEKVQSDFAMKKAA